MEDFKETWKNKIVFEKQLELNKKELEKEESYPYHWRDLLIFLKKIEIKNILDIGCGCGALSELIRKYHPEIEYTGVDYAQEAIDIARAQWPSMNFFVDDYRNLTKEIVQNYDAIYAGGLHNILPDGDDAMKYLISLEPKIFILGKILPVEGPSHFETYKAYGEITTYKFFHNYTSLINLFSDYGITEIKTGDALNILLERK